MKLGWISKQPAGNNTYVSPASDDWFETSPQGMFSMLYPDEPSALIDIENPDLDLCAEMDALLFVSGTHSDSLMLEVIDDLPCKILAYHEGGEQDFLTWIPEAVLANRKVMDKSDLVLVWDTRALGLHKLYTKTPVLWWPLPYPIEYMDKALLASSHTNDILVSYPPYRSCNTQRNSILGCALAQSFIDNLVFNTAGVFSNTSNSEELKLEREFLDNLGCYEIGVIPRISSAEFLATISEALLVINLDYRRASGRITLECALTRTPVIASDQQPFAYQLYNGIRLHDSFDVSSMIDTGIMVDDGRWHKEWLDLACERAQHYSYTKKAKELEEAVMSL